jgi:hypothetical protein
MAQLPDENVIAMPQPGSRRPVSAIDVSGYARGAAAMGSAAETLGKGITSAAQDVAAVIKQEREAERKLQLARAQSSRNAAFINQGNAVDRATDPANLEQNIRTAFDEVVQTAAAQIDSPHDRELFVLGAKPHGAQLAGAASRKALALAREAGKARDREAIRKQTDDALVSSDPNAVNMAVHSVRAVVDGWAGKGWSTPEEAHWEQVSYAQDFAGKKIDRLPLAEQVEVLRGGPAQDGTAGARYAALANLLPRETRESKRINAERRHALAVAKASYDTFGAIERTLADAAKGLAPLPPPESIERNPNLQPSERSRARALHDTAAAKLERLNEFTAAVVDQNGRSVNASDPAMREAANVYFNSLGRSKEALWQIVQRTNIIPEDAVTGLRGALASGKVPEVFAAMRALNDLPDQALANLKDGGDLAEARETYRAKLMVWASPARAAHDYVEERKVPLTPELVKQKRESVDKLMAAVTHDKVRTYVQPDDWYALLSSAAPALRYEAGGSNAEREAMLHQFREVVRDVYLKQRSPDIEEAMAKAAQQFKKTFGLSTTYGPDPTDPKQTWSRPRLMQYAPAAWSGYAPRSGEPPLEDIEGLIKKLAAKTVVKEVGDPYGYTPNPDNIMLTPLGFKQTAERFLVGDPNEPPAYLLSYKDQRDNIQTIGIFEAKPWELRQIQTEERDREMKKLEAADNALMDKRLLNMPQGKADRRLRLGTLSPGDYVRRQQLREESAKGPSRLATAADAAGRAAAEAGEIASGVGQAVGDEWKRSPWIY